VRTLPRLVLAIALSLSAAGASGCTGARSPGIDRPADAEKWYRRAKQDLSIARVEEANEAVRKSLAIVPADPEVRILAGHIALARLEYAEVLRLLQGVPGSEAQGLRGRALWYKGELDGAADELEAMLQDPEVRDEWAKSIAKLARRGAGRTPFRIGGGLLAPVELAHVSPIAPYFVAPVEIDGEEALALISTGVAEVVLDSATRPEPSWMGIRFAERVEVQDVPALSQDLSGISKEVGAPIKALLGVNLLRHLNATLDYAGHQFVVRTFAPPPPPSATRVPLFYARGGGMLMPTSLGAAEDARAALFVDTMRSFPIALDDAGWAKAGIAPGDLKDVPGAPTKLKEGVVPLMKMGAFDLRRVPGVLGAPIADVERGLAIDIDGILGTPVFASYRITFADGGRMMWVEDDTELRATMARMLGAEPAPAGDPPAPAPGAPPPAAPPAPGPAGPAPAGPAPGAPAR
jgi:hypothetical protein